MPGVDVGVNADIHIAAMRIAYKRVNFSWNCGGARTDFRPLHGGGRGWHKGGREALIALIEAANPHLAHRTQGTARRGLILTQSVI